MAEKKENKRPDTIPRSIRISDETMERFEGIANELNTDSKEKTLAKLIDFYHLQEEKGSISGHKDEIESFESMLESLRYYYLNSLKSSENALETARNEVN